MTEATHCIINGHLVSVFEMGIPYNNRAFRYGDAVFESIRSFNGRLFFLKDHMERLKLGMAAMRMLLPAEFNSENINNLIALLLAQNQHRNHARVRLTVFRNEGGGYTPQTNTISFLIESEPLINFYELNAKGLWLDIFTDLKKSITKFSAFKNANALLYTQAGLSAKSMKLDDAFILNELGNICESIHSNVFIVKNGSLYTPPISEGCINGIMRKQIFKLAKTLKFLVFESPLTVYNIMNADEVFLTNSIRGIEWVGQFREKFYSNRQTRDLMELLCAEGHLL